MIGRTNSVGLVSGDGGCLKRTNWKELYKSLKEQGKVFDGDKLRQSEKGGRIEVEKSDGMFGIEFNEGGIAGFSTALKNFSRSLPPENGIDGTVIMPFKGCDVMGKRVYFLNVSTPWVYEGGYILGFMAQDNTPFDIKINVTE